MGWREQKKEETRRTLLNKAAELFGTKGYQAVTTAEIARAAGIAEGTLFNYFRGKGELFIAAMMPESSIEEPPEIQIEEISPSDLAAVMVELLDRQLSSLMQVNKRLLQDYFSIVYGGGLAEGAEARASLLTADERMLSLISRFLVQQKERHPAPFANFDVDVAASCIFGCTVTLLNQYVIAEDWTYEQLKQSLYDQILFVLTGHVKSWNEEGSGQDEL
ncbi:TetR/AcrR family transcriptional regulator [Marinicrinis lubricantis]|uniref:TetR/AcrR family transcriptional regulator n=1 Tax=Marinicrinis lubricantis TaxID=2086470 RepID=A0ABW1IKK8_9BACL